MKFLKYLKKKNKNEGKYLCIMLSQAATLSLEILDGDVQRKLFLEMIHCTKENSSALNKTFWKWSNPPKRSNF